MDTKSKLKIPYGILLILSGSSCVVVTLAWMLTKALLYAFLKYDGVR